MEDPDPKGMDKEMIALHIVQATEITGTTEKVIKWLFERKALYLID